MFFLLLSSITALVVTLVIRNITDAASQDYARFYSTEAVNKFNVYLNRELGLVTKVARSAGLSGCPATIRIITKSMSGTVLA